jgi:hypothetical protein
MSSYTQPTASFVPSKSLLTSLGTKYAAIVEELLAPITPPQKSDFGRGKGDTKR